MPLRETSPGVFYSDSATLAVGVSDLAFLLQEARRNDKHGARICAHPDVSDAVHEMVICLLDKCYIRPHLHHKAESLHVLEGTCDLVLLDASGEVLNVLGISGDLPDASRYVRLPAETYHTLLIRSEHVTFHETTRGPLDPADTVFGDWSPPEGSAECTAYIRRLDEEVTRIQKELQISRAAEVYHRDNCRLCGSRDLQVAVPLAASAIADAYLPPEQAASSRVRYPLDLYLCNDCGHVQLLDVVDPNLLFGDYTYRTSSSLGLVEHFRNYADVIHALVRPPDDALAVEIGSNDGTLLRFFQGKGMRTLGIDPATTIAREATDSGIETLPQFFTSTLAADIVASHGKASLVAANNVFAQADELGDIAAGVQKLLASDGVFVFEVSYLVDIVDRLLFDTVYHEHLCYHSVKPLDRFLTRHGMQLIEVLRLPTKGGSIRCIAQLAGGPRPVDASVPELLVLEETKQMDKRVTYERFTATIDSAKDAVHRRLTELRSGGTRTAGFGASATVTTLLHHFALAESLEFLVDDNRSKWGLLSPGHHLQVRSPQCLADDNIGCVVILAWAYAKNIMKNHRDYQTRGGQFLVPLPVLEMH